VAVVGLSLAVGVRAAVAFAAGCRAGGARGGCCCWLAVVGWLVLWCWLAAVATLLCWLSLVLVFVFGFPFSFSGAGCWLSFYIFVLRFFFAVGK